MIIDTHTHVVSSDKVKHPLDPGARGWSTEVSNDVEAIERDSGLLHHSCRSANRKAIDAALSALEKRNVFLSVSCQEERNGREVVDVLYTLSGRCCMNRATGEVVS